jgi:hypothetical protein
MLALFASVLALGCGGGDDEKPPQINAQLFQVAFGNSPPGTAVQQFQPIIWNSGDGTLEITNVEVRGDVNCAMNPAPVFDVPLPISLTHAEQVFLNLSYLPGGTANGVVGTKDQISVAVTSNSAEYPLAEFSVCGCVVDGDPLQAAPCECNLLEVPAGNCGG